MGQRGCRSECVVGFLLHYYFVSAVMFSMLKMLKGSCTGCTSLWVPLLLIWSGTSSDWHFSWLSDSVKAKLIQYCLCSLRCGMYSHWNSTSSRTEMNISNSCWFWWFKANRKKSPCILVVMFFKKLLICTCMYVHIQWKGNKRWSPEVSSHFL